MADVDPSGTWEIRWDRTFSGWWPAEFEGVLSLRRDGDRWAGDLHFRQSAGKLVVRSVRVIGDHLDAQFEWERVAPPSTLELSGWIREGKRLIGEMRAGGTARTLGWTPFGGRRLEVPRLMASHVDHSLPSADPAASGIAPAALNTLLEHAQAQRSSAVVILRDGKIVVEAYREGYDGSPLVAMSASKSVASLAIGLLVADGKLSLDTTMGSLFPEWKFAGPRAAITVRQLLTHTSGLDPRRAETTKGETIRARALEGRQVFPPGARFQYNNTAVDFLSVVFKQASGMGLDEALEARILGKLDVVGASWQKDLEGMPRAAGELSIRPVDLAKIGQLMLDGGIWHGEQILTKDWIEHSVEPGQPYDESCGLLWWREGRFAQTLTQPVLQAWLDEGMDSASLAGARALFGRRFDSMQAYWTAVKNAVGDPAAERLKEVIRRGIHVPMSATVSDGDVYGFAARGWLGQYLVVIPKAHVVAVRMRASEGSDYANELDEKDGYPEFADDVRKLF